MPDPLSLTIFSISLIILLTGLISSKLQTSLFSQPLIAIIGGICIGPLLFGLVDLSDLGDKYKILEETARFTLAMAVMSAALKLPSQYPLQSKRTQIPLILLGVFLMSSFSAVIIYLVFGLPFMLSFLIGTIVAPTDPVIASTIVSGKISEKLIPERIRNSISGESGANDGIAFPFVMLPLLLITREEQAMGHWFFKTVLWESAGAVIIGVVIGYAAAKLLKYSLKKDLITPASCRAVPLCLSFLLLSGLKLIDCNGIIGVFAGGLALNYWLPQEDKIKMRDAQEAVERIFMIPVFVLFGMAFPWQEMLNYGLVALLFPLLILLFRRLPAIFLMKPLLKDLKKKQDLWFVGWFGPVGIGALYYSTYVYQRLNAKEVWIMPAIVIFASAMVHAFTAYPFVKWYSKRLDRKV